MNNLKEEIKIKKGQLWKSKASNVIVRIIGKWSGNKHWLIENPQRKNSSHHIHEGTLKKFYNLITK
jgi:hypothetical protein